MSAIGLSLIERIRGERQLEGLTQREAAALVGVSVGQWEHYEAGRRNMRARTFDLFLGRLADRKRIRDLERTVGQLEQVIRLLRSVNQEIKEVLGGGEL